MLAEKKSEQKQKEEKVKRAEVKEVMDGRKPEDVVEMADQKEIEFLDDDLEEDEELNIDDEPDEESTLADQIKDPYIRKRKKMMSDKRFREISVCEAEDL